MFSVWAEKGKRETGLLGILPPEQEFEATVHFVVLLGATLLLGTRSFGRPRKRGGSLRRYDIG